MLDTAPSGRHRGATRYNPWSELSTIVKSAGQNGVKATAVLAASGGLAATFALPAQAQPRADVAAASEAATFALVEAAPCAPTGPAWWWVRLAVQHRGLQQQG